MRQIAKLMLNSLYGKFATRTTVYSRRPMLVNDVLRYVDLPPEERDPVYLPAGVFITAWARYKTITTAQSVYDRFIYADTDSVHLIGTDIPDCIDVDAVRLGAWKHESTFYQAKFLRAKCYMEYEEGSDTPTVHVAGMPSSATGTWISTTSSSARCIRASYTRGAYMEASCCTRAIWRLGDRYGVHCSV